MVEVLKMITYIQRRQCVHRSCNLKNVYTYHVKKTGAVSVSAQEAGILLV